MRTNGKVKERGRIFNAVAICLFFVYTVVFHISMESYYAGAADFWFLPDAFLSPLLYVSIGTFALLLGLTTLYGRWLRGTLIPLLFGLAFMAYLQSNFLNADYGLIDGHEIDWASYGNYGSTNAIIWLSAIAGALVLYNALPVARRGMAYLSLALVLMQGASLTVTAINYANADKPMAYSRQGINDIGDEKNITILIADTFDVRHMEYLIDKGDESLSALDGFTFYNNAVAPYTKTAAAIPYFITGIYYKNEKLYADFLRDAYENSAFLHTLDAAGYDIRLYLGERESIASLKETVSNIISPFAQAQSDWALWKTLFRYCLFREAPHACKAHFSIAISDFNSLLFVGDADAQTSYVLDDPQYYARLKSEPLTVLEGEKTLRMIHLNACHAPYNMNAYGEAVESSTVCEQLGGTMRILGQYLENVKESGQYDDTAIMILGDHGAIQGNQPALLFKPLGARGEMKVSNAPVAYEDIHNTLLKHVGLAGIDNGEDILSLEENVSRKRMFYNYRIFDPALDGYLPAMWEGFYTHDNHTPEYTHRVFWNGQETTAEELAPHVALGEVVDVANLAQYFNSTFLSWGDGSSIWTAAKTGVMMFRLDDVPEAGVSVTINFIDWIDVPEQIMRITASDGTILLDEAYTMSEESVFTFSIPAEYFGADGSVVLDISCPVDTGYMVDMRDDLRKKAFALESFVVRSN